jgi:hypothetical protein
MTLPVMSAGAPILVILFEKYPQHGTSAPTRRRDHRRMVKRRMR